MGGGRSWSEPAGQSWLEQGLPETWRRSHDCRQLQQEWLADDALRESDLGERPATRSPSARFLTRRAPRADRRLWWTSMRLWPYAVSGASLEELSDAS